MAEDLWEEVGRKMNNGRGRGNEYPYGSHLGFPTVPGARGSSSGQYLAPKACWEL